MSWEPRPVPDVTPETEEFWSGAADGKLLLSECEDCGLVYHYPRALCPDCFSDDVEWIESSGRGEIYSYSTAKTISGWPEEGLPLVIAYVELEEGPRMMTNVTDIDPDVVEIGDEVEVTFVPTDDDDIAVPTFTPVE